jgi:hypothetical protein
MNGPADGIVREYAREIPMLIDEFLPQWEVRERHRIRVQAAPEQVYRALRTADLGRHPVVRGLLLLRALPAAILARSGLRSLRDAAARPLTLAAFEAQGFRVLAESPPRELLIGVEGAFWRPGGDLRAVDPSAFREPVHAGTARAAWNFHVVPDGAGSCLLHTETRVLTGDATARRRFRRYWLITRPGSGLIRQLMLRAIRAEAERSDAIGTGAGGRTTAGRVAV